MATDKHYHILILGGGLSGTMLAISLANDPYFEDFSIGIIDSPNKRIDKYWSFWEKGNGTWDSILYKKWNNAIFNGSKEEKIFELGKYHYKTIRSIDFFESARRLFDSKENIDWIEDDIIKVEEEKLSANSELRTYSGDFLFDGISMPNLNSSNSPAVIQHFKGWTIQSEQDSFDDSAFRMMDYRLQDHNQCSFIYVLPFSKKEALIEFTYFSPKLVENKVYEEFIQKYIENYTSVGSYSIINKEAGKIPMSTFDYSQFNTKRYTRIGTAGGWVKASSGYSFKSSEKKVSKLLENLKANKPLTKGLRKKRFKTYDRIFLRIFQEENQLGSRLFEEFYLANKITDIFKFLDEETKFVEELRIINKFKKAPFLRSLKKELKRE